MSNLTNSQKLIEEVWLKAYRSELGRTAFTNDFHDLDNIPSETIVNNSTIRFQKNWVQFDSTTTNAVNDKTINIIMTQADVWLGNVDNTSDAEKPISNATQTALNSKANANNVYTKWEVDAAISTAISSVYRYKGSVLNYNALPSVWMVAWDVYNVENEHVVDPKFPAWTNVAWTWSEWDPLSWNLAVDWWTAVMTITQEQYDALPESEKQSNTIFLIEWDGPGGTITVAWNNVTGKPDVMINPLNGVTWQVLTKTASWYAWAASQAWSSAVELTQAQYDNLTPEEKAADVIYLITGEGQTLTISWNNVTDKPDVMIVPANWSNGQVLTKTANWYEWLDWSSKTMRLTQQEYDALPAASKQADIIYLITWQGWTLTVAWANVTDKPDVMINPQDGYEWQVLMKMEDGYWWDDIVTWSWAQKMTQAEYDELPEKEKESDTVFLITGTTQPIEVDWENVNNKPSELMYEPSEWSQWQVLTSLWRWYEWADPLTNRPITKLTQAQYDALTPAEKNADVVYMILAS